MNRNNTLYIMVGGPAAGKSTVRNLIFDSTIPVVDCDEIKKTIPGFDPKNPATVHDESSRLAFKQAMRYLSNGQSFIYDSTGTNLERLNLFVSMAHESGLKVHAIFVTCSLETAIERNNNRERTVDENLLREKHRAAGLSWNLLKTMVDSNQTIINEKTEEN